VLRELAAMGVRSYIAEPERGAAPVGGTGG